MFDRRSFWPALLALVVLGGCESTASLDPKQAERRSADRAVITFTVSHDKDMENLFRRGTNVKFFVYLRDAATGKDLPRAFSNMETLAPLMTSPIDGVWARVFVREVEPGRIEFTKWEVVQDNGPMGIRVVQPKVAPIPMTFDVQAGTTTYIGNLHAKLLWAKNPLRIEILAGAVPEIRDESERDLKVVYKDYPALQGKVQVKPMRLGPWMPVVAE
jgi:hypothetical protein